MTACRAAAISASAAAEEVARQYKLWKEGLVAAAADATDGGRLRLVTPEQGSPAPSTATQPAPSAPAGSADLQSRVQQLESELAEARRLLEVRNAELATLQGTAVPPGESAAPAEAATPAEADATAVPGEEAPVAGQPQAEAEAAAQPEPEPKPEAQPAAPAEEPSPGLVDRLLEYWWALLALLAAALGIIVILRRRRASESAETDLSPSAQARSSTRSRAQEPGGRVRAVRAACPPSASRPAPCTRSSSRRCRCTTAFRGCGSRSAWHPICPPSSSTGRR